MKPYYQRDNITIFCGDCLEVMPGLEPPIDAIIADLPYGTTACAWDTVIPFEPLWSQYKRLIKKAGAVVLFGSQPFTSALVMSNPKWFRYEWIWEKDVHSNFANAEYGPLKYHENIVVFSGDSHLYSPQMRQTERLSNPSGAGEKKRVGLSKWTEWKPAEQRDTLMKYPKSVLYFNKPKHNDGTNGNFHPTQKPVALLAYLIRTYTNPGELILDNTMGSGTTLLAAQNEGRRAAGIEQDEEYCRIAVDRLRQPSFFSLPSVATIEAKPEQAAMDFA